MRTIFQVSLTVMFWLSTAAVAAGVFGLLWVNMDHDTYDYYKITRQHLSATAEKLQWSDMAGRLQTCQQMDSVKCPPAVYNSSWYVEMEALAQSKVTKLEELADDTGKESEKLFKKISERSKALGYVLLAGLLYFALNVFITRIVYQVRLRRAIALSRREERTYIPRSGWRPAGRMNPT